MVLEWSASKPDVALSLLRNCVDLLEKDLVSSAVGLGSSCSLTAWDGGAPNACLDAFSVALGQTCDGKSWYTSTKELQLASLPFCAACRSVTTLALVVNDKTPRTLMAVADAPLPSWRRLCASRVPRLRARRVWWNLQTATDLKKSIDAVADATEIFFARDFVDSLTGIVWPQRLSTVKFDVDSEFNLPIGDTAWPASLRQLTFGECFDQAIRGRGLPESLEELTFGSNFDQSVEETQWPPNLLRLTFGFYFNQPIEAVMLPDSVEELELGDEFNRPIRNVRWPASLQKLNFEDRFNQPIEGVTWPGSIRQLSFGQEFDQPIDRVEWPASLAEVSFGCLYSDFRGGFFYLSAFNQAIDRATWPASLRRLTLGHRFRHSLKGLGVSMPNLEELCLMPEKRSAYKSLLRGIKWPHRLRVLTVYSGSRLEGLGVPKSVKLIYRKLSGS
ncbi:unnamed protein product [Scytosiphon promiscuus]